MLNQTTLRALIHEARAVVLEDAAPPVKYVGLYLDARARATLDKWWAAKVKLPMLPERSGEPHVTLAFKPTPAELAKYAPHLGKTFSARVNGWAADDKGQAVTVRLPSLPVPTKGGPHISIAYVAEAGGVYSNTLIAKGDVHSLAGPTLDLRLGLFTTEPLFAWPPSEG